MLRELGWLKARTERGRLLETGRRLVGPAAAELLPQLLDGTRPSVGRLWAFGRHIVPSLAEYRLFDATETARQMLTRELGVVWWKVRNWYLGAPTRSTRTVPQGGLTVAFLGADGAGKTTVTRQIADWLSREIAVVTTYGGSGKGSASLSRRIMQRAGALRRRLMGNLRPQARRATDDPTRPSSAPPDPSIGLAPGAHASDGAGHAQRRRQGARHDRHFRPVPQSQFPGGNDGPRLSAWRERGHWVIHSAAPRREDETFRLVEAIAPTWW
jgi:hypothetical protein